MRAILIGLILFPVSVFAASEGLRVVYDIEVPGDTTKSAPTKMKGTYYIQEGAVRFETEAPAPAGSTVLIGKAQPKKAYLLFPTRKAYMEVPENTSTSPARESQSKVPFKPSGKSKEIAGYSCRVMTRELEDRKEEACTSDKLAGDLKNLQSALPAAKGSQSSIPKGLEGFPLEYQVFRKKAAAGESDNAMTMRVAEVKREKLNSSLFEVPNGWQKQEMPAMSPEMMKNMQGSGKKGQQKLPPDFDKKMKEMRKMMEEQQKQKLQQP